MLEQLLRDEDGAEAAQVADAAGRTPLHVACLHGHSKCAEMLISTMSTASIAAEDALGRSARAVASPKLDPAIAQKLRGDPAAGQEGSAGYGTEAAAGSSRTLLAAVARLDAMPREDYEAMLAAESAGAPDRSLQSRAAAKQQRRASDNEGGPSSASPASNGAASGGAG